MEGLLLAGAIMSMTLALGTCAREVESARFSLGGVDMAFMESSVLEGVRFVGSLIRTVDTSSIGGWVLTSTCEMGFGVPVVWVE